MPFNLVNGTSVIRIDNSTGTILNLSDQIDTCSAIGKEVDALEVTAFADSAERFVAGIEKSKTLELGGPYNGTSSGSLIADWHYSTLVGTIQTVEINPGGTASGRRKITGEFLCVSFEVQPVNKQVARWRAVHRLDGTLNSTGTN